MSVFIAVEDQGWVRHTVTLVCKYWDELYRSQDASPLHETLELHFRKEVERASAREGGPHHEGRCAGVGSEPPCCPRLEGHLVGPEARRLGAQAAVRGGIPRSF